jgi:hypothetical protein
VGEQADELGLDEGQDQCLAPFLPCDLMGLPCQPATSTGPLIQRDSKCRLAGYRETHPSVCREDDDREPAFAGERTGRPALRQYNQTRMVKRWLVRLELARDDNGSLSDEGMDALMQLLAEGQVTPVLTRGESGTVLVQLTLDARDPMAARSAAEHMLREGAASVWSARGLPPFTIAFVDATEGPR